MNKALNIAGTVAGAVIGSALIALCLLILVSDCGPDGYGQRECLDEWSGAVASVFTAK